MVDAVRKTIYGQLLLHDTSSMLWSCEDNPFSLMRTMRCSWKLWRKKTVSELQSEFIGQTVAPRLKNEPFTLNRFQLLYFLFVALEFYLLWVFIRFLSPFKIWLWELKVDYFRPHDSKWITNVSCRVEAEVFLLCLPWFVSTTGTLSSRCLMNLSDTWTSQCCTLGQWMFVLHVCTVV